MTTLDKWDVLYAESQQTLKMVMNKNVLSLMKNIKIKWNTIGEKSMTKQWMNLKKQENTLKI